MRRWGTIIGGTMFILAVAGFFWLWTPSPTPFDRSAAREAGAAYEARLIRDRYGVPHIYAERDADVAFGLAYAHAEDDWPTMKEVLLFSRGALAQSIGPDGAITDFLVGALGARAAIEEHYETALPADVRAIVEGYAAGLNYWCAEKKSRCAAAAPIHPHDIVAGFATRTPFFYGLDDELKKLFEGDPDAQAQGEAARAAFLNLPPGAELGSNAMAVAPSRSADGHTRLMVNSHQPYTGPVAWYEARVKSEEGWDMIGGLFPGAPLILHGAGPRLGWAFTVNKPDLVDIYKLETDRAKNPKRYRFDGDWRPLEKTDVTFRVKLFGPFSLPVRRRAWRSVHGPVLKTPSGFYAVAFAGDRDIRAVAQWFAMNKARSFDDWRAAMAMQAIPSFHVLYGDREGNIGYFYNAAIPDRTPEQDWRVTAEGARSDLVWNGVRAFGAAPQIINPQSGYVVNANNGPFEASAPQDTPDPDDFAPHLGVDRKSTNRGLRITALFGDDASITEEEFLAYKMDNRYAPNSRLMRYIASALANPDIEGDPSLEAARALLAGWDGATDTASPAAGLAIRFGQLGLGILLNGENAQVGDPHDALRQAVREFEAGFGRIDPEWGAVNRLKRGVVDLPLNGAPDVLRAVYALDNPEDGAYTGYAGDTYILYADWARDGEVSIETIHQFGAATVDASSPHYADQAPIFAQEAFRTPPMALDDLIAEATTDKRIGGRFQEPAG